MSGPTAISAPRGSGRAVADVLRWAGAAAAVTLLAGCGANNPSTGDEATTPPSTEGNAVGPLTDVADPGDDLLDNARRGVVLTGTDTDVSWRLPEDCYESLDSQQAACDADGGTYELVVGGKPGVDVATAAEEQLARTAQDGQSTEPRKITLGGRDFTVIEYGGNGGSVTTFLHRPPRVDATYAVIFTAPDRLADVPQERLDEVYQMLGALEFEPAEDSLG